MSNKPKYQKRKRNGTCFFQRLFRKKRNRTMSYTAFSLPDASPLMYWIPIIVRSSL